MIEEAWSYEQDEYETVKESKASRAKFAVRCLAALAGSVAHNTGVWTILDEHVNSGSWGTCSSSDGASTGAVSCSARNFACMVLGTHSYHSYCMLVAILHMLLVFTFKIAPRSIEIFYADSH